MKVVWVLALFVFTTAAHAFTFDNDVPLAVKNQMLQDLDFIKGIQGNGASPLHQKIYGQVNGAVYDHFFQSRVHSIGMSRCGSLTASACVMPDTDPSKMWLTESFTTLSIPQIARMMIVYHETRHTEVQNKFWPHAKCPPVFTDSDGTPMLGTWSKAPLADHPDCDSTPFGSYGSSSLMMKNIAKWCTNCTEKVKQDADFYADDQFKRIIDPKAKQDMKDDIFQL